MRHEFTEVFGRSLWLMDRQRMRAILERALSVSSEVLQAKVAEAQAAARVTAPTMVGDVAVISMAGPITYKTSWFSLYFGGACIDAMQAQFRMALNDSAVKAIVFRCDSPGGSVEMVPEFADEIYAARGQKPMLAVADTMIASAAYWLASQADQIYVARSSSEVGAIGTYCEHQDISDMLQQAGIKITLIAHGDHKVDGNPYEPLSDAAQATIKAYVDEVGVEFESAVARGRGVTQKVVVDTFGQGDVVRGKRAVSLGMADKVATWDQVMARAVGAKGMRAFMDAPAIEAIEDKPAIVATIADDVVDPIDPNEDGSCPDGYDLRDDGQCYPALDNADTTAAALQAQADRDALHVARA